MSHLAISLLGSFQVIYHGEIITKFASDKVRALLSFLFVESEYPHRREKLAGLLWPESPERLALQSLSQAVYNLRNAIRDHIANPPFLLINRKSLQINPQGDYWLDVGKFSSLLENCHRHPHSRIEQCHSCIIWLRQAIDLYQGDFLCDFSVHDSSEFEEWILITRERLHCQMMNAVRTLIHMYEESECYEEALEIAWKGVKLSPTSETANRQLIRILALSGQRETALEQYEIFRQILVQEWGIKPEKQLTDLYHQILSGMDVSRTGNKQITHHL